MVTRRPRERGFSWSASRHETFRSCLRRYYLHYYASRGGWREDAEARTRELWMLRNLVNRRMWVGDLVHRSIGHSLTNLSRRVPVLEVERIVEITLNVMRNEYRASRRGDYRRGSGRGLFEHEYGLSVSDGAWKEAAENCARCLRNFYASEVFAGLSRSGPDRILEVETLSSFSLGGTTCWVVLDAAWRDGDRITVADWKTGGGEPGGHELQMTGYALYAGERWKIPPERVDLLEYNLQVNRAHRYPMDAATADRTVTFIQGSMADMISMLADPAADRPLEEDRFPPVDRDEVCRSCNFLRICRPGWSVPGGGERSD